MLIVGERINTSRKSIKKAVAERDREAILLEVRNQIEAGADFIDVHAASPDRRRESDDLCWVIESIQEALPDVRFCIDSVVPESLKAAMDKVHHAPMVNSITAERSVFKSIASIIEEQECHIVALCIDDRGVPKSAEQVVENASGLIRDLEALGLSRDRIYVDPVIQAVSTNTKAALTALESVETIKREFQDVHLICGLSNVSFGLPVRHLLNRTFLSLVMKSGLDAAIVDPTDGRLMSTLRAAAVLLGQDTYCQGYTRAFREGGLRD
jgi:5-methyltetrahydrofolate--homocysteine methyltransferase